MECVHPLTRPVYILTVSLESMDISLTVGRVVKFSVAMLQPAVALEETFEKAEEREVKVEAEENIRPSQIFSVYLSVRFVHTCSILFVLLVMTIWNSVLVYFYATLSGS